MIYPRIVLQGATHPQGSSESTFTLERHSIQFGTRIPRIAIWKILKVGWLAVVDPIVYIHNMVCLLVMAALNYVNFMLIAGILVFFLNLQNQNCFSDISKNIYSYLDSIFWMFMDFLLVICQLYWILWIWHWPELDFLPSDFFRFVGGKRLKTPNPRLKNGPWKKVFLLVLRG